MLIISYCLFFFLLSSWFSRFMQVFLNCVFPKASKIWFSFLLMRLVISTACIRSPPCSIRSICVLDDFIGSEAIIRGFCLVWGFTSVLVASSSFWDLICILKSHVVRQCLLKCQWGFGVGWGCSNVCLSSQLRLCSHQSQKLHRSGHFREKYWRCTNTEQGPAQPVLMH